jgi:hypothetical protein
MFSYTKNDFYFNWYNIVLIYYSPAYLFNYYLYLNYLQRINFNSIIIVKLICVSKYSLKVCLFSLPRILCFIALFVLQSNFINHSFPYPYTFFIINLNLLIHLLCRRIVGRSFIPVLQINLFDFIVILILFGKCCTFLDQNSLVR